MLKQSLGLILVLISFVLSGEKSFSESHSKNSKPNETKTRGGRPVAERSNKDVLLTNPIENAGSYHLLFETDAFFGGKVLWALDITDLKRENNDKYKAKARLSNLIPGKQVDVTIKRDPILKSYWVLEVEGFTVLLPFIGPVLAKPDVYAGSPLLGVKANVKKYWAIPKLK